MKFGRKENGIPGADIGYYRIERTYEAAGTTAGTYQMFIATNLFTNYFLPTKVGTYSLLVDSGLINDEVKNKSSSLQKSSLA